MTMGNVNVSVAQNSTPIQVSVTNQSQTQRLILPKGKSAILDLPVDARDVVVSNPKIADAVMRTQRRGFLLGMELGETNVYFQMCIRDSGFGGFFAVLQTTWFPALLHN